MDFLLKSSSIEQEDKMKTMRLLLFIGAAVMLVGMLYGVKPMGFLGLSFMCAGAMGVITLRKPL